MSSVRMRLCQVTPAEASITCPMAAINIVSILKDRSPVPCNLALPPYGACVQASITSEQSSQESNEVSDSHHQGVSPIWWTLPLASRISCCAGSGMVPSHCPSPVSVHSHTGAQLSMPLSSNPASPVLMLKWISCRRCLHP